MFMFSPGPRADLATPSEFFQEPPAVHSTGIKMDPKRRFFPSLTQDSSPETSNKTYDLLNKSSRSSLGLLPDACLEASATANEKTTVDWQLSDSIFKKPEISPGMSASDVSLGLLPRQCLESSSVGLEKTSYDFSESFKKPQPPPPGGLIRRDGLDERLLRPTTPREKLEATIGIDTLLGSTVCDVSTREIDAFNWSEIIPKDPPKITIEPPSSADATMDASFFKGALSGRSTSIGGSSNQGRKSRTLDEKFEDFSNFEAENVSAGFQMNDDEFGPVAQDNLALMNEDEKMFKEGDMSQIQASFAQQTQGLDITSKTDYFTGNTSRLGSLESYGPNSEELRPQLGFGKIVSPTKEPFKMLDDIMDETQAFSKEEKKDLKSLLSAFIKENNANIGESIKKHLEKKINKDDTVALDAFTSFLEMSQIQEEPKPPKSQSKIPVKSPSSKRTESQGNGSHSKIPFKSPIPKTSGKSRIPLSSGKENKMAKPMMGTSSKLLKPLADSNKKQRHSSPIKAPVFQKPAAPAPVANPPASNADIFPIQSSRLNINWIGTEIGLVKEQVVVLKNVTNNYASVNLALKDCQAFSFPNGAQSQEITMEPSGSLPIVIHFVPQNDSMQNGVMTIRVHGYRNKQGKAVKSSLQLRGFVGKPKITVGDAQDSKLKIFDMNNDVATVKEIELSNDGCAGAFIALQLFQDEDLKQEVNPKSGAIRLDKSIIEVNPGQSQTVQLRIDPDLVESRKTDSMDYVGSLVVQFCSDLALKILQLHCKAPPFLKQECQDPEIKRLFSDANDLDLEQCAMEKQVLKIYGAKSNGSFYALPVEETLSESMMNSTSVERMLLSCTVQPIPEEESSITVERDKLFAPDVKVGDSSLVKVKIKNQGSTKQTLSLSGLRPPFSTNHAQVEAKSKFFVNVPILYSPKTSGNHECVLTLNSVTDGAMSPVQVVIKGSTLK